MIGIYSITNSVNGKIYIGYASNIRSRWSYHKNRLDRNTHDNAYLQNAWDKYGKDAFSFSVIESQGNRCSTRL